MRTIVLYLSIAVCIHRVNDLFHHGIRIFHRCQGRRSSAPVVHDRTKLKGEGRQGGGGGGGGGGTLTMINLLEALLQCFPIQFPLVLKIQLLPQLFNPRIPLVLGLGQLHLELGDHGRDLHLQCS